MSKIFSKYENDVDKVWYDSSNIFYSECDDKENELKTLRITFKDGRQYEYYDVDVNQYLLFRESVSQGRDLNKYIKQYECKRIDDNDINLLQEVLEKYTKETSDENKQDFDVKVFKNHIVISHENTMLTEPLPITFESISRILNALNIKHTKIDADINETWKEQ